MKPQTDQYGQYIIDKDGWTTLYWVYHGLGFSNSSDFYANLYALGGW